MMEDVKNIFTNNYYSYLLTLNGNTNNASDWLQTQFGQSLACLFFSTTNNVVDISSSNTVSVLMASMIVVIVAINVFSNNIFGIVAN